MGQESWLNGAAHRRSQMGRGDDGGRPSVTLTALPGQMTHHGRRPGRSRCGDDGVAQTKMQRAECRRMLLQVCKLQLWRSVDTVSQTRHPGEGDRDGSTGFSKAMCTSVVGAGCDVRTCVSCCNQFGGCVWSRLLAGYIDGRSQCMMARGRRLPRPEA